MTNRKDDQQRMFPTTWSSQQRIHGVHFTTQKLPKAMQNTVIWPIIHHKRH